MGVEELTKELEIKILEVEFHSVLSQFASDIGNKKYPIYKGRGFENCTEEYRSRVMDWRIVRYGMETFFKYLETTSRVEKFGNDIYLPDMQRSVKRDFLNDIYDYHTLWWVQTSSNLELSKRELLRFSERFKSEENKNGILLVIYTYFGILEDIKLGRIKRFDIKKE